MKGTLHWMLPVALAAAVLAPLAAAQAPDLGLAAPDPASTVPDPFHLPFALGLPDPFAPEGDAPEVDTREGQDPTAADDPAAPQPPTLTEGGHMLRDARDDANDQVGAVQDAVLEQAQAVQGEANQVLGVVPEDPIGFATAAADRTAHQAADSIPNFLGDTSVQPQAEGTTVVAGDNLIPPILAGSILVATAAGATFFAFWLAGSSGTLGAGAVAKGGELRRLLPFASPLFTRFEKETVLGHPRREALYASILQQPGISLQALGEATGLSRTAVLHHLRLLELQHLVVSKRLGRSRHYYENGGRYGRDAKEAYAILQNQRSKEVADYIRLHPGTMQKELCEALAIQPSIAHWHVRRLQAAQLVDAIRHGRAVNYFPGTGLLEVAAQAPLPQAGLAPPMAPASLA
ncbi:MAG TPA: winged helix-turn-helix transcriptional regulator [Candidatus Thermoplasmatota archaeon]|nr:winged helix-turn-helix transcriptional regulator [Candidatus Thermoplasmatota archaeon]